jgi:hypothetical protein
LQEFVLWVKEGERDKVEELKAMGVAVVFRQLCCDLRAPPRNDDSLVSEM